MASRVGHHHETRRREEPPGPPPDEAGEGDGPARGPLLDQEAGDEEARDDEEDIDADVAAGEARHAGVEGEDHQHRDGPEALHIGPKPRSRRRLDRGLDARAPAPRTCRAMPSPRASTADGPVWSVRRRTPPTASGWSLRLRARGGRCGARPPSWPSARSSGTWAAREVGVDPPVARQDPPPRQVGRASEHVGHGLAAAGPADLVRDLAEGHELARLERLDGGDDRRLERRRPVVVGPRLRVGMRGATHGDSFAGRPPSHYKGRREPSQTEERAGGRRAGARAPGVRRRQPLLRGARRVHPPPRSRAGASGLRVGRDRRPQVPRRWADRSRGR